jgi:PPP family 3-phenylpropionic acid transporter
MTSAKLPDKNLFFARAYYFAYMGGWGFILPFINLYYVSLGLSGTQIGSIGSLSAVVGLFVSPVIVTGIKKSPRARGILQLCLLLGAAGYFLLGQQTIFPLILVLIFFHTIATAGIMHALDSMAVSVVQEIGNGYGSVPVSASVV